MKKIGATLLLLALTLGAWGETLAMTIDGNYGDLGEEHEVWTSKYYTDAEGRLSRVVRVTQGAYDGDPATTWVTEFHWDDRGVSWNRHDGEPVATKTEDGFVVRDGKAETRIQYGEDADGFFWNDDQWIYRWTPRSGYQAISSSGERYWTTVGARLTWWVRNHENEIAIMDRTPTNIVVRYIQLLENNIDSEVKGEIWVSGIGLWHADPQIRLLHAYFLNTEAALAWAAPLVWNARYLK